MIIRPFQLVQVRSANREALEFYRTSATRRTSRSASASA
jgi:hypothetical protein